LAPDLPAGARAGLDSDPDWSMFLPAAGHRKSDGSIPSQTQGYYWSTAAHDETVASILHFYSAGAAPAEKMNSLYTNGMAVRCVEAIPEGVRAVPGMIGYYANGDNEGQITLDGDDGDNNDVVLAAYFKFGSMVALNQNTAPFSAADVLATPSEYDESKITNWASVPYLTGPVSDDPENGTGDPCAYYFGSNGGWKTPTTTEMQSNFFIGSSASVVTNPSTSNPVWLMHGSEKVLPAAGARNSSTGLIEERGEYGYYWTSTDWSNINGGWILYFYSGQVGTPNSNTLMGNSYGNGHPVRCVQEVPGIKAPRGVIGYIKDTNELTLEGDKDLPGSTQTKETVYVAYFKFGSLIATSSQDNDEEFTPADIVHVPDDYDGLSSITDWTNVPYKSGGSYAGSSTTVNYWEEDADSSAGLGDPCIYYFEDNDGGTGSGGWRLPTTAENIAYVGRDGTSPSSSGENPEYHNWIPNNTNVINPGVETFPKSNVQGAWLPAAGQRIYNASEGKVAGSITNQGSSGLYWSSRASSATSGSYLSFNSTWVHPNNTTNKQYGYAVRCVPTYIPSPGGEVIVGDIAWAKANVAEPGTFAATEYMYDTNIHSWVESRTAGLPQGVCPDGWRLPTKAEFQTLIDRATNSDTSGSAQGQWITSSNTYGRKLIIPEGEIFLSASGGDIHDGNGHDGQGGAAFYLTSESDGNTTTGILQFGPSWCDMTNSGTHTDYSISVRCVRDL
jgi:uncharacterized protein (TIGR02145 family)